jgi:hypothetical protein
MTADLIKMNRVRYFLLQTRGGKYSTDSFLKGVTELYKDEPQKRRRAIEMVQECDTLCELSLKVTSPFC